MTLTNSAPFADRPGMKTSGLPSPTSQEESRAPSLVTKEVICSPAKSDSRAGRPAILFGKV